MFAPCHKHMMTRLSLCLPAGPLEDDLRLLQEADSAQQAHKAHAAAAAEMPSWLRHCLLYRWALLLHAINPLVFSRQHLLYVMMVNVLYRVVAGLLPPPASAFPADV